jgi:hypothetical protein
VDIQSRDTGQKSAFGRMGAIQPLAAARKSTTALNGPAVHSAGNAHH